ncbi:MAG: hypothetical protein B7C24_17225 [Bacteroidetes bacterium 4572_77]|nr:MAG: hypothetical protein B7C24_17225 [Bacteroidetes bacterium 4572_77]
MKRPRLPHTPQQVDVYIDSAGNKDCGFEDERAQKIEELFENYENTIAYIKKKYPKELAYSEDKK